MAAIMRSNIEGSQQPQSSTQRTESQPQLDSSPVVMAPVLPSTPPQPNKNISSPAAESTPRPFVGPLLEIQESRPGDAPATHADIIKTPDQRPEGSEQIDETILTSPRNRVKRRYQEFVGQEDDSPDEQGESQQTERSFVSTLSVRHSSTRREAYFQMLEKAGDDDWAGIGLISTDGNHTVPDKEL